MAFIEQRGDWFRIIFRYAGKRFTHTLNTQDRGVAEGLKGGIEKTLMLLQQNVLRLPEGVDVLTFVVGNGQVEPTLTGPAHTEGTATVPEPLTLAALQDRYLRTHSSGAMEKNSLATVTMHLRHFLKSLGAGFVVQGLKTANLQEHIDRRAQKKGIRNRPLSPTTLRKEMASLRACWNWAVHMGLLTGPFPNRDLTYPKGDEKPPFKTFAEIERQLARGATSAEEQELWDCLYLTPPELAELLQHVQDHAAHGWIFPLCCFGAHTGARRSEMLRVLISDVNFADQTVLIREKKRSHQQRTTRRVPLTPFLAEVLQAWLAQHPGGQYLFCHQSEVFRSKKRSRTTGHQGEKTRTTSYRGRMASVQARSVRPGPGPLTKNEIHDHFKRTLAGSKWAVLRGFHLLRHSYISCLASAAVDQRIIDEAVGHQTEQQRRRYRHLYPSVVQDAIARAFGSGRP